MPTAPFLPPIANNKLYTLVLDLDETLIHYDVDESENEGFYLIRPGALKFLYEMKYFYEIVVFTAAIPEVRV
jgi:TFIIF-interacting CTD phosphatase-like protein